MASAQSRRKARSRALELLFSVEFTREDWRSALDAFWRTFESKESVREYAEILVEGAIDRQKELDEIIDAALTGWTPDRVGHIERNVLRIAVLEMGFVDETPPKVALNEAIELAKAYGSDESPGFVNAVLDRIMDEKYRESTA